MTCHKDGLTLRPYQLIEIVCCLGGDSAATNEKCRKILAQIQQTPDLPITLVCNASDVYVYQNPGAGEDTQESVEFNLKRDLEILYRLNLFPGATLPARIVFSRLLDQIEDLTDICVFDKVTADTWQGSPQSCNETYRAGRTKGIEAIIPPRPERELEEEKGLSIKAMHQADAIKVRPHMLLCSVCQFGNGVRPPFAEDNLPELLELVIREPNTLIEMAPGAEWMMCAPCPSRSADINACVNNRGSGGLPNQLRDLRVLQKLGLAYGSRIKARDLFQRIFECITGTLEICGIEHGRPSVWWTGCGSAKSNSPSFDKGREQLTELLSLE